MHACPLCPRYLRDCAARLACHASARAPSVGSLRRCVYTRTAATTALQSAAPTGWRTRANGRRGARQRVGSPARTVLLPESLWVAPSAAPACDSSHEAGALSRRAWRLCAPRAAVSIGSRVRHAVFAPVRIGTRQSWWPTAENPHGFSLCEVQAPSGCRAFTRLFDDRQAVGRITGTDWQARTSGTWVSLGVAVLRDVTVFSLAVSAAGPSGSPAGPWASSALRPAWAAAHRPDAFPQ